MDIDSIDDAFEKFKALIIGPTSTYNVNIDLLKMIREYARHNINIGKYNHFDELLKNINEIQLAQLKATGNVTIVVTDKVGINSYKIILKDNGIIDIQLLGSERPYGISFMKYPTSQIRKNIVHLTPSERRAHRGLSKSESRRQHRIFISSIPKRGKLKSRRGDRDENYNEDEELPDLASLSLTGRRVKAKAEAQAQAQADASMDFEPSFAALSLNDSGKGKKSKKTNKKSNKKSNKKTKKTRKTKKQKKIKKSNKK